MPKANPILADPENKALVEQHAALIEEFRTSVCVRSQEIDPDEARDWFDLSYGWLLAKGLDTSMAWRVATVIRYGFHYWS